MEAQVTAIIVSKLQSSDCSLTGKRVASRLCALPSPLDSPGEATVYLSKYSNILSVFCFLGFSFSLRFKALFITSNFS